MMEVPVILHVAANHHRYIWDRMQRLDAAVCNGQWAMAMARRITEGLAQKGDCVVPVPVVNRIERGLQ